MYSRIVLGSAALCGAIFTLVAQAPDPRNTGAPIYQVTVVERTIKTINYRYRSEPTPIDFRGTVLLPKAKGMATVASKQGRTEIDANFEQLTPPTPFGREYLTYVLWALTPDGRPHNLGEIIANSRNKGGMHVSTDLQAFALIVTAEPYAAVRKPSDVVVLENEVRPDTSGIIEQVNARYELLPRGHYTWRIPDTQAASAGDLPKVPTRQYEHLLEIYQAQSAIAAARGAGADQYSPDILAKAETLLQESRQRYEHKGDRTLALQEARQASETAEDARLIAEERQREEHVAKLKMDADAARRAQADAEAAAAQAQVESQRAHSKVQAELEEERAARLRAEAEATAARQQAAEAQSARDAAESANAVRQEHRQQRTEQLAFRERLLQQFNSTALTAKDTPRGLVIVIPDSAFSGTRLNARFVERARLTSDALARYRTLHVDVESHSDNAANQREALARAQGVASILRASGVDVTTRDIGSQRPLGPNDTAQGRQENRRVEIVISGDPIGTLPVWDRTYSLSSR